MKNVLVVAVHPDDETLGCGGTLLRLKAEGVKIHWLLMTAIYAQVDGQYITLQKSGEKSCSENNSIEPVCFPIEKIKSRAQEIANVSGEYGFDSLHELCLPAMSLDQYPLGGIISKISKVMYSVQPNTIILPFKSDVHSDHRVTFEAASSCTKSFRYPFLKKILMMETLSETDFAPSTKEDTFIPNVFMDISGYIDKKIEIMELYKGEMDDHPFPRSKENLKALALNRGACSGYCYAESFMLLKERL